MGFVHCQEELDFLAQSCTVSSATIILHVDEVFECFFVSVTYLCGNMGIVNSVLL